MALDLSFPPNNNDAGKLTKGILSVERLPAMSGDVTSLIGTGLITLNPTGVVAGIYSNPFLNIDSTGRIVSAGNGTVSVGTSSSFTGSLDSGNITYVAVGLNHFFPINSTLNVFLSGTSTALENLSSNFLNVSANKEDFITPGTVNQYYRGDKTFQTLDKTAVGLSNVDNTSDANKPVSNATQTALNLKADLNAPVFTGSPSVTSFINANHTHTSQSQGGVLSADAIGFGVFNAGRMPAFSGDIFTSAGSVVTTLTSTGVIAGVYANASISVDSKGRILSAGVGSNVFGPDGATDGDLAVFNGSTGKSLRSGGSLGTWPGSTFLNTVGTLTGGTWTATPINSAYISSGLYWNSKVNSGQISATNLSMNGPYLLGRYSSGTGPLEYIAIGSNLTLNSNGLSGAAAGGGGGSYTGGLQTVPINAGSMISRFTSGCGLGLSELTGNKIMCRSMDFDALNQEFAQFSIPMPKSWNEGTVTFQAIWCHGNTNTNFGVVWGLQAMALSDAEPLDTSFGTAQEIADTGGVADYHYVSPESSAITIGSTPAEKDTIWFQVYRKPADASDTLAVDAKLLGVRLYLTTNSGTDA